MPITLPCYIDTYPKVKLESVPLLVEQLELNDRSLFDYWVNHRWETVTPSSILLVEKGHPVILRCRPSLIEELPLSACPGISEIVQLQSRPKRAAESTLVSPLKKSQRDSNRKSAHEGNSHSVAKTSHSNKDGSQLSLGTSKPVVSNPSTPAPTGGDGQQSQAFSTSSATIPDFQLMSPQEGKNLLERSVFSWDQGWKEIKQLLDGHPEMTKATAFPQVFGLKYVKSTVCNYKKLWGQAPSAIRTEYIGYGDTGKGSWRNFASTLKKGIKPPKLEESVHKQSLMPFQAIPTALTPTPITATPSESTSKVPTTPPPEVLPEAAAPFAVTNVVSKSPPSEGLGPSPLSLTPSSV